MGSVPSLENRRAPMTTLGESWRERRITHFAMPDTSDGRSTHSGTIEPTCIGVPDGSSL